MAAINAPYATSPLNAGLVQPISPNVQRQVFQAPAQGLGPSMALAPRQLATTQVQPALQQQALNCGAPVVQQQQQWAAPAPVTVVQPAPVAAPLPHSGPWNAGGVCPTVAGPVAGTAVLPAELAALINAMQDRVDSAYLARDYPQRHRHRHT